MEACKTIPLLANSNVLLGRLFLGWKRKGWVEREAKHNACELRVAFLNAKLSNFSPGYGKRILLFRR